MIRTIRAFFLGCQLRERLLLVIFLVIAVLLWFSGFSKRAGVFWREQHRTTVDLSEQAQWLANSANIEASAQKSAARLDASKTLDDTRLVDAIQKIASDAGLHNTTSQPPGNPLGNGQFAIHKLDYSVRLNEPDGDKNWNMLKAFYTGLEKRSPYIGIELFTVRPNAANPAQLDVAMRVSSVEIAKGH